jgi:D-tagatose 6-phosphate 4-epimerase
MSAGPLLHLAQSRASDAQAGFTSVCSAHPVVIEATLRHGLRHGRSVLLEATCNQVNQEGGYTGLDPAGFMRHVLAAAEAIGFPTHRLMLGGDHLGPNPWTALPAAEAMGRAAAMVEAYAAAGFVKIHLDASMPCAGDPEALAEDVVAERAASLAAAAERAAAAAGREPPVYVIGTEVPPPGGAGDHAMAPDVTRPEAALRTVEAHRAAFARHGIGDAFGRVVGLVVQPGVEFGNEDVARYDPAAARALAAILPGLPGMVFEAHSTDYQDDESLSALVRDGFAILKVGPWLTFALREALYGLDAMASFLRPGRTSLVEAMEALMLARPDVWSRHYRGSPDERRLQRHFSYSDRIRYLWQDGAAVRAVADLFRELGDEPVPAPLASQYLACAGPAVADGRVRAGPKDIVIAAVERVLDRYAQATH